MTELWLTFAADHKALAAMAPAILLISGFLLLRWSHYKILGVPVPPLISEADTGPSHLILHSNAENR